MSFSEVNTLSLQIKTEKHTHTEVVRSQAEKHLLDAGQWAAAKADLERARQGLGEDLARAAQEIEGLRSSLTEEKKASLATSVENQVSYCVTV
jgi:molecular chaperone GrpE (heat shock protein)